MDFVCDGTVQEGYLELDFKSLGQVELNLMLG